MTETILVPFVSPDCPVIDSYPYKFILAEDSLEFFAKHTVEEMDEKTELPVTKNYDARVKMMIEAVVGFEMYKSTDHPHLYVFKVTNPSGEVSVYVNDKSKATELYNKFNKWLFKCE